jgi:hypothetical protein
MSMASRFGRPRPLRWAVVGVACALRVALVRGGGQFFWPDEARLWVSVTAVNQLRQGAWHAAFLTLFSSAEHLLFKVFGLGPALLLVWGHPRWEAGLFFAAASTWVIWSVGDVSLAAGADEGEALLATVLAAATSCLFYYARHFFPYDLALGFLLSALALSLRHPGRSLAVGLLVATAFLTYSGYWYLGAVVLLAHAQRARWGFRALAALGAGLASPVLVVLAVGCAMRVNLLRLYLVFSGTVTHGDFGTAWRFIPEYLYVSEHGLALLWLAAVAGAFAFRAERRVALWLALAALLGALLVAPSDLVHRFTVSARQARQLAPLLCLLTAAVLRQAQRRFGAGGTAGLALLIGGVALNAAAGFAVPLRQTFPDQFFENANRFLATAVRDAGPYTLANYYFLDNPDSAPLRPGPGTVVYAEPHPYQFAPYLYDTYTAAWRADFRRRDLRMRLVRLPAGGPPVAGYPLALRLTLVFPPPPALHEPLVVTGVTGRGDGLYVGYGDEHPGTVQFGHDHFGGGARESAPVAIDRAAPHVVTILLGSLLPPPNDPIYRAHPSWLALKHETRVVLDGRVVLRETNAEYAEAPRGTITVGLNLIGLSTSAPVLTARILRLESVSPDSLPP